MTKKKYIPSIFFRRDIEKKTQTENLFFRQLDFNKRDGRDLKNCFFVSKMIRCMNDQRRRRRDGLLMRMRFLLTIDSKFSLSIFVQTLTSYQKSNHHVWRFDLNLIGNQTIAFKLPQWHIQWGNLIKVQFHKINDKTDRIVFYRRIYHHLNVIGINEWRFFLSIRRDLPQLM